jgi:signal transduction histidine kinase
MIPRVLFANGRFRRRLALTLLVAATIMAALTLALTTNYNRYREAQLRAQASLVAASAATTLGNALNQRLSMVRGLAAFATVKTGEPAAELATEFPNFARSYMEQLPGIRNISLSPNFVVSAVFPTDPANLKVLGNNILEDKRPDFADAVRRAMASRGLAVHEPVPLIQGGFGLIARHAVFAGDRPWGAVGMVFNISSLIESARLEQFSDYDWALRTAAGTLVAGDAALFDQAPALARLNLPEGYWELAMAPKGGWAAAAARGPERQVLWAVLSLFWLMALIAIVDLFLRRERLEQLVDSRTKELTTAHQELERFAFVTAHDLQEPLRRIQTISQLAERSLAQPPDERAETAELLVQLTGHATRMRSLLHDVQAYLGESRFPLPDAPLPARVALDAALKYVGRDLEAAGATLSVGDLPSVPADHQRLSEIFRVLLENAVEYRDPSRPLAIRIAARRDGRGQVIEVSDNGIGIEPEYWERIFEVFQRLHDRQDHPGNGMGLAIAAKMARRLGGSLSVRSQPGQGSTFTLSLPA